MYREEMVYCKNGACHDERKEDGNGERVLSFFKVMIAESSFKVLYFPPKFARSISHLKDQETYVEDSSGRQYRVTVCNHNDSLAIVQGWPKFSSEHGLKLGEFLVFYYVPSDQHFIVKIFGLSGCERINFGCDIDKGKQKPTEDIPLVGPKDDKSKEASLLVSLNADEYSCVVKVDDRDFLELPESWQHLLKKATKERVIIFLRGPDKRIWPTFYHSRSDFNVLTSGWKQVAAVLGLNPGDSCCFQLVNQQERMFDVCKI